MNTKQTPWPPKGISLAYDALSVREALDGKTPLYAAFVFEDSPQGHRYWQLQDTHGLTPEGRAILESWLEAGK